MLSDSKVIPQLNTTLTEPLYLLERHLLAHRREIDSWFVEQWALTRPPVYGSVDLRNAGFKLAPIDMNLFPAGFNNLNPESAQSAIAAAESIIRKWAPGAKNILVIPENHTRNLNYWANIKTLERLLITAGFAVRFGMLSPDIKEATSIQLSSGESVAISPLQRMNNKLFVSDFEPDMVLLNNDLSDGIPDILRDLQQPLFPPAELGWHQRLKSAHFQYYAEVVAEFAALVKVDPWLLAPLFRHCGQIDFMQQGGMDCLISNAEILFEDIQKKYAEYGITSQPFLIVKADAGTYGMAVMTVRHIDELKSMNRKQRTKMATTKGGQPVRKVIIQEGVYTFETIGAAQSVAEPVVYLWGCSVVGGFYRVHKERGVDENLNAPGMHFEPLAFTQGCNEPRDDVSPDACQNRYYTYGIVAKLSMLAAAREMKDNI